MVERNGKCNAAAQSLPLVSTCLGKLDQTWPINQNCQNAFQNLMVDVPMHLDKRAIKKLPFPDV